MSTLSKDLVATRLGEQGDHNFICATWLKGLYYGNDWFNQIEKESYYSHYGRIVNTILGRPWTNIRIACLKDDPEVVLAYAIYESYKEGHILHWVFTKSVWRKLGIAKSILPIDIIAVTHLTKMGRNMKPKEWAFDPFFI